MFALDGKTPAQAFRTAYLCGLMFFGGTLYWLMNAGVYLGSTVVMFLGVALLIFYLALYFGVWGWAYSLLKNESAIVKLFLLSSVWVVLEFIRGHFLSGFDWVSLGYSQYKVLPVIQMADMTGVVGVSF